jgi:CBS-domain-containing membrane protein
MTSPVVRVDPGVPVTDIARKMLKLELRRLPVVDDRGVMIGIISRRDLLKVFVRSDQELSRAVRNLLKDAAVRFGVQDLRVNAQSGIVMLEGHVTDRIEAKAIEHIARGVDGVVDVRNRLRVRAR